MRLEGTQHRQIAAWIVRLLVFVVSLAAAAQTIVGPDQMNFCDTETYTTTITNASVTQSACLLEITRSYTESGVFYVPGSTTITLHDATVLTDDPTGSTWTIDALLGSAYALPPTESITISYQLETTCAAVSGTEQVTVDFEDCADPGVPLQNISSTSIEILPGAIVVSKTPSIQDARVGDAVTWTITVENTGLGRVDGILITDELGPGLAYVASTGGGSNAGQTTTWDGGSLEVGETVSVDLTAEVIACTGLFNDVDAAFGCGPAGTCFDTAIDEGTATASLNLIVDNPDLSFTPPNVIVGYCTDETAGLIQITNSGAGTARNVELCCDIAHLTVDPTRLPPDTTYSGGCFQIPDIAPGATFDLTFYVLHSEVDWCADSPSGSNVFELTYANDCDIPFVAFPQFSTLSSEPGPSLNVTKTGPDSLRLGETGSYDIAVEYVGSVDCGGGSPGPVSIVDTYPEGFTVVDPAGGTVDAGARTITWAYDPNVDPPFAETIQLEAPTGCGYCAQPGGGTDANSLTATGTDCCGCPIVGTAEAATTILCEGYGGVAYFSSSMSLDRTTTVRCSSDYAVTITHTYTFIDDPALDDFLLDEFTYFVDGNGNLVYSTGSASVTGGTLGSVVDNTPSGRLELPLTDSTSVRGQTIIYEYTLIVQDLDSPSCQATTIPVYAGIDLEAGAPELGLCGTMYADPPAPVVTAQPPSMSVSIDGIPEIQEYCATYDVTITLTRTSALAKPYDARIVLTNNGGSVLDMSQATCGGDYSPTDGTTCTAPIVSGDTYEWRYADLFDNDSDTATITFPVTVPCSGPLANLSVIATFDDLCHDDAVYEDSCSTSSADEALLSLSANVFTRKSPEILYATTRRDVAWTLVVHNTGNGAAYNVWLDDTLGSGLVFDEANTVAPGATVTANQDHEGNAINGATFLFDEVAPGELITITYAADLVACDNLTNDIAVSWGCDGSDCQVPRTDDSIVVIPPANLIATSFSPTPIPMCSENTADVTVKNAGVTTVYNIIDTVTLPTGLQYLGNPEVQINGGGWSATGEPTVDGQTLTWTSTETPELASADPSDIIEIRFTYTVFCDFAGGNLTFQATYEDPCGDTHPTNIGVFALGLTPASVSTTLRQIDPAPGEALDCGGQATWEIDVVNTGTVELAVVQVEAFLDAALTFVSSSGDATYGPADGGTNTGQSVFWELEDLPIDATATFQVTAAAASGGLDCEALDIDVDAFWGCGDVDGLSDTFDASCTTTSPATGTISAIRRPPLDLAASLSPGSIEACADTTELTLTITNDSTVATTSNVDFVITLPDELTYVGGSSEIDCGAGYGAATDPNTVGQTLTWYNIGAEGGANDGCESIPPGGTIQLRFDVAVSCFFTTQDIPITVYSYDCCGLTQYDTATAVTLTSLLPALSVDKSPANTELDCYDAGDTVTWTITVTNSGTGVANWVRVVDTLGSSLVIDSFTDLVDETPSTVDVGSQIGQVITWEADVSLAPGESLSATVTAHADQPSDDCSRSIRRNTAVATWGCGTLAASTCEYGTAVQDQSTVRVPNLTIGSGDITPIFDCTGDGITPGSGQIEIVVRNSGTGDAAIADDFTVTVAEPNTGFSVSDTFTGLGGVLPLNDDSPQTLTLDGWDVACTDCAYAIEVTLDAGDGICECTENDNQATLTGTITLPDLVVDSAALGVTCTGDGQVRIQGPVTLRNDGCGDPLIGDVLMRFRIFDGANCTGSEIDTFTVNFSGLSIAANGGTDDQTVNVVRTLAVCNLPDCELSIQIEADDDDAVCECDGTNNTFCAGTFPVDFPDLTITDIDFSNVSCSDDSISGFVRVAVENDGCGDAGAFVLRLATDGCLSFADENIAGLTAGSSTNVDFAITSTWADCTDCSCTFTATIDPGNVICECDGTNNSASEPFTSTLPDLEISGVIGSIGCAVDGQATVDADVTVENTGCADVTSAFDIAITLYDGANCTGNVIDSWTETISGETIAASGSTVISLTQHVLGQALCAGDCGYSARFEVDSGNDICECDGTDNEFCLSSITSEIADLVVTEIDPVVDCQAGTASVTATVGNVGCEDAAGVIFRLTSSGCAPTTDSAPIDLIAGASQDIVFNYTPDCEDWNCTFTVTADPDSAACECDGGNSLSIDPYPGIGSIGDRVWFDTDAAGDQDPGELGIANVTVILEADLDGDGLVDYTAETTTDANGEYLFDELPAGEYTITVDDTTLPDGMGQTYDYDGLGTPHTSETTLAENEHNREQDFSYRGLGSIGDYVWFDANADGVQDPSETGIEDVTVTLEGDLNGDGINEILTTTTDADGLYLFDFLPAGPYTITVDDTTLPDGLSQTYDYDGLGTAHTSDYTLGAGEHNREQDFGYATPALSVDKVIVDILRGGASIGNNTGPVEPGDVIVYQFTIENVGPVPAYEVGFDDTLPAGIIVETDAPGDAGSYVVSDPSAIGSLALTDGAISFNVPLGLTVNAGETLTATFTGIVTSSVSQGDSLTNTAHAVGEAEDGTPIPGENALLGDTSDTDVEDPDADDTGIVAVPVLIPALSVDKTIADITRSGSSIGIAGPVEPGDVVSYEFVISNVGGATAYEVDFADTLPAGMETLAGGTYVVTAPADSGSLGLSAGAAAFTTSIGATIDGGETLTAAFDALITSSIVQGVDLVNTAEASGIDGFGTPIPDENPSAGDLDDGDAEDPDADDTGIAIIGTEEPALSVDKVVADILRRGSSIGNAGPVEPGDIVFYQYTITNVGLGTAYGVDFTDTLPTGMLTETDAPGDAGSFVVTDPSASGSLALSDNVESFSTTISAVIAGGETLTATYTVIVTSSIEQGVDLVNVAATTGVDGAGNPIPGENADVGDTSDGDAEDPDADDTGIALLGTRQPALTVDKRVTDVLRSGMSLGVVNPVLYGDIIEYTVTIRNVGLGTAYGVEFTDTLPAGLETETQAPGNAGSYSVTSPPESGTLSIPDAVGAFTTSMDATISGGETLTATYTVLVSPSALPGVDLVNTVSAVGEDGAGTSIPEENAAIGDTSDDDAEDPDADDTGIATVRVGAPALVTRKAVIAIDRQGTILETSFVEPGDIVTYEVGVSNVGAGPAQNVNLTDVLPAGFSYEGNPSATWPSGSSTADPAGVPGPSLVWTLNAALEPNEELVIQFDVRVTVDIEQGEPYVNTITATGEDANGDPIPPDHSDVVPEDDDPDDSSEAILTGAVPALVAEKTILNITRNGSALGSEPTVQSFDVVTYQLEITNVGFGTAYEVDVRDVLPAPFAFVQDTARGTWPYRIGDYTRNPSGAPGPTLVWDTDATLESGDTILITFDALVNGTAIPGNVYTNFLHAEGSDGSGTPIPPNRSADVPGDIDLDDRDEASLTGVADVPALVTTKRVSDIIRAGDSVIDNRIEEGDIVEYELTVRNVGSVTAYGVDITDRLPSQFGYINDTTSASWPLGSSFSDPSEVAGQLQWLLHATLRPEEQLAVRFLAFVIGPIYDGSAYANTMKATGEGPDGSPIPEDQRSSVPGDIDPDDASQATLIGRSAFVEGEGGSILPVPILRKTAEIIAESACPGWQATIDRVWFQTDIAMFASAEFETLASLPTGSQLVPETYLPTWTRTVHALSSIGVAASHGPLIKERAIEWGITAEQALERRLGELAARAGVSSAVMPRAKDWIYLEYEGGEPIYASRTESPLGPQGQWTERDEDIVASALGMGLVKQVMEAETLLGSKDAVNRYLGWTLTEILTNKVLALETDLMVREQELIPYIPHSTRWDAADAEFAVQDEASVLFGQISLVWGLSHVARFAEQIDAAWTSDESALRARLSEAASRLLHETLIAVETFHFSPNDTWFEHVVPESREQEEGASIVDLGLLLVALEAARPEVEQEDRPLVERLARGAIDTLVARQDAQGWFSSIGSSSQAATWSLLAQTAGIRGLLAGSALIPDALDRAQRAFDALDRELWVQDIGSGVYANQASPEWRTFCYTPLEIGLTTGALRELALLSNPDRQAHILHQMSSFVRTIVDDAALQLSNAAPSGSSLSRGGDNVVAPIRTDDFDGPLAPVLQQRLCLSEGQDEGFCGGWTAEARPPWYQTDISMFAAYVLQDRLPSIEDYADANLSAVFYHSELGIPCQAFAALESVIERMELAGSDRALPQDANPIAIPFASGSPELIGNSLAWNPETFDERIVASALGMTLLRESQEVRQLLDAAELTMQEQSHRQTVFAAILQQIVVLQQLQLQGPDDVSYVPHATSRDEATNGSWIVRDSGSTTFDQLSLLLGLSEAYALLTDSRVTTLVADQPFSAIDWDQFILDLAHDVLQTLEVAHLDPIADVLVDAATPSADEWIRGTRLSTVNLGLLTTALDRVMATFGNTSPTGTRALALIEKEVAFLHTHLMDVRGGYDEVWPRDLGETSTCSSHTLASQLAALRSLQIAQDRLGLDAASVHQAFETLNARFWDDTLRIYRSRSALFEWCVTPLDLGLVIDTLSRVLDQLTGEAWIELDERLSSHVDRILDGITLQLSSIARNAEEQAGDGSPRFAPVFDAQVCLQSNALTQGERVANPGDTIRYTVSAENATEEHFYNLLLEDHLPEGLSVLATDPVGLIEEDTIRWSFDELLPSERRSWQILAQIDEAATVGDAFLNCALLNYTNATGDPQPEREACADVEILSPQDVLGGALDSVRATYLTDEAMHLSTTLEALACSNGDAWNGTPLAHDLAATNLGELMMGSNLGIPLRFAPDLDGSASRRFRLEEALAILASSAGLPEPPAVESSILLPYESGIPIRTSAADFPTLSDVVTPAALGWTLAREAQAVSSCHLPETSLDSYLIGWTQFAIANQLTWISTSMISSESGATYLPQATRATISGEDIAYGVSDARSTIYDQASLLIGLLAVAQTDGIDSRTQRLAEQLATDVFDQLLRHWDPDARTFIGPLEATEDAQLGSWHDQGIAAQALQRSRATLTRERGTIDDLLSSLAEHALSEEPSSQATEEAGRLLVLLIADHSGVSDQARPSALAGWRQLLDRVADEDLQSFTLSAQAVRGWGNTPGQLSLVFDLLAQLAQLEEEKTEALRVATALLSSGVMEDRAQLLLPTGMWALHTQHACSSIAPVFGQHRGTLPAWFDSLP